MLLVRVVPNLENGFRNARVMESVKDNPNMSRKKTAVWFLLYVIIFASRFEILGNRMFVCVFEISAHSSSSDV